MRLISEIISLIKECEIRKRDCLMMKRMSTKKTKKKKVQIVSRILKCLFGTGTIKNSFNIVAPLTHCDFYRNYFTGLFLQEVDLKICVRILRFYRTIKNRYRMLPQNDAVKRDVR